MKLKRILNAKKTKCKYVLETDKAGMQFIISGGMGLRLGDCKRCVFELCCQMRRVELKSDLCTESAQIKEEFLSSCG